MTIDLESIGMHVLVLMTLAGCCVIVDLYGRRIAGWGAVVLFCLGEYGWALLALFFWLILDQVHREEMFKLRFYRIYNGPWIA
jgi:hypothetical protein